MDRMPASSQSDYWDTYYATRTAATWPSQFATFVLGEIPASSVIIDIGCGSGRDALFFASQGFTVLGVDGSPAAIGGCIDLARANSLPASFLQSRVDDLALGDRILAAVDGMGTRVIYARFFLHAINGEGEDAFLTLAQRLCRRGDRLALEFRTIRDATQPKVTSTHYRRFIEPTAVVEKAARRGFTTIYFVEGFGLAKYQTDDAYVARIMFELAR